MAAAPAEADPAPSRRMRLSLLRKGATDPLAAAPARESPAAPARESPEELWRRFLPPMAQNVEDTGRWQSALRKSCLTQKATETVQGGAGDGAGRTASRYDDTFCFIGGPGEYPPRPICTPPPLPPQSLPPPFPPPHLDPRRRSEGGYSGWVGGVGWTKTRGSNPRSRAKWRRSNEQSAQATLYRPSEDAEDEAEKQRD